MATVLSSTSARVCISLAQPSDADAIALFARRLSAPTRRSHWGRDLGDRAIRTGPRPAAPQTGLAVVARDRDAGVVVGHATAVPADDGVADIAVAVADAYEGEQIATLLLGQLIGEARRRGIVTFRADALARNHRMIDVFVREGYVVADHDDAKSNGTPRKAGHRVMQCDSGPPRM